MKLVQLENDDVICQLTQDTSGINLFHTIISSCQEIRGQSLEWGLRGEWMQSQSSFACLFIICGVIILLLLCGASRKSPGQSTAGQPEGMIQGQRESAVQLKTFCGKKCSMFMFVHESVSWLNFISNTWMCWGCVEVYEWHPWAFCGWSSGSVHTDCMWHIRRVFLCWIHQIKQSQEHFFCASDCCFSCDDFYLSALMDS